MINNFKFEYKTMKESGIVVHIYRMEESEFNNLITKLIGDDGEIEEYELLEKPKIKNNIELEKDTI